MWTTLCPNKRVWILPVGLDFVSGSGFCPSFWICQWVWIWKPHGPDSLLYHMIYTQPWHNIRYARHYWGPVIAQGWRRIRHLFESLLVAIQMDDEHAYPWMQICSSLSWCDTKTHMYTYLYKHRLNRLFPPKDTLTDPSYMHILYGSDPSWYLKYECVMFIHYRHTCLKNKSIYNASNKVWVLYLEHIINQLSYIQLPKTRCKPCCVALLH